MVLKLHASGGSCTFAAFDAGLPRLPPFKFCHFHKPELSHNIHRLAVGYAGAAQVQQLRLARVENCTKIEANDQINNDPDFEGLPTLVREEDLKLDAIGASPSQPGPMRYFLLLPLFLLVIQPIRTCSFDEVRM